MRDCNKCIHHISGSCSAWKCEMQTLGDYRNKAIDEFAERLKYSLANNYKHLLERDRNGFDWITTDAIETHIDEIAEQLKAGEKNE